MDLEAAGQIFSAGKHLEQDGQLEQAIACYRQATNLDPNNFFYYYKLGLLLRQQDRLKLAKTAFETAIALNNQDSWSYHALAEINTQDQDFPTAIENYKQAIKLNSSFSWSHYNLGRVFHQQKQLELAQNYYQEAIKIDPDFYWSHYFLAEILASLKHSDAAFAHYQEVVKLNPQFHEAYYPLARYLHDRGELDRAVDYYYQAIKITQDNYHYYYNLGKVLIELDRFDEAINCYEQAIKLQPNNIQSYFYLGKALINQEPNSINNYRHNISDKYSVFKVNFELGLAQAWQQLGKFDLSIKCCQRAIKIDPAAELPFRILQYIPIEKELDRVIDFYQQIAKSNQANPLLWGNLGDLLTKRSRISEAIDCYRTSCYENTIIKDPQLINFDWQHEKQNPPDFAIIGATKCGTTSLFAYLNQHPQVLAPHKKEINFFNHNFEMGVPWYLAHFPAIADAPEFITGEASPFYIYNEQVISRIQKLFPNLKLVIMLRNPIERTVSEYYHAANHGLENRSFEAIIKLEVERLIVNTRQVAMRNFGYLLNSIYVEKIVQWNNNFPSKNILIITSESFFEDTALVMKQVCNFLAIPYQNLDRHIRYNVGTYPPVTPEIKHKLQEFFAPFNQELEAYLDRKFNW